MNTLPKIVLPEGEDERVLLAAKILINDHICHPVLLGGQKIITDTLGESDSYTVISPDESPNTVWQGATLVSGSEADGIVAGAVHSTADVLRSYIKVIGMREGVSRATSCFLMEKGLQRYLFADCAVNIDPSVEVLADTAYLCNEFASLVGIDSKVAFLSFSTYGSANHEMVDKITAAVKLTKEKWPDMVVDGELQFDAAVVPSVANLKAPDSTIKGDATVFVFPDLNSGNIAYKLVERLGEFKATGPLLLGFKQPAHDLSRGCNADDIVNAVKITCLQLKS